MSTNMRTNYEFDIKLIPVAMGELEFTWHGAHTVNVWNDGENIDVFSVGDFAQDAATFEEVLAGCDQYVASSQEAQDDEDD